MLAGKTFFWWISGKVGFLQHPWVPPHAGPHSRNFPPRSLSSHKPWKRLNWNGSKKYIYNAFNFNVFQSLSVIVVTCLGFIKDQEKRRFVFFSCCFFCFCLDFLVSIKAILLRTTNTHQAYVHSGDTVLSYSFYNKRKLVNSCFWLCFFFFPRRSWCKRAVLYIFYNTLWLLKIKICGKRVCVCEGFHSSTS